MLILSHTSCVRTSISPRVIQINHYLSCLQKHLTTTLSRCTVNGLLVALLNSIICSLVFCSKYRSFLTIVVKLSTLWELLFTTLHWLVSITRLYCWLRRWLSREHIAGVIVVLSTLRQENRTDTFLVIDMSVNTLRIPNAIWRKMFICFRTFIAEQTTRAIKLSVRFKKLRPMFTRRYIMFHDSQ